MPGRSGAGEEGEPAKREALSADGRGSGDDGMRGATVDGEGWLLRAPDGSGEVSRRDGEGRGLRAAGGALEAEVVGAVDDRTGQRAVGAEAQPGGALRRRLDDGAAKGETSGLTAAWESGASAAEIGPAGGDGAEWGPTDAGTQSRGTPGRNWQAGTVDGESSGPPRTSGRGTPAADVRGAVSDRMAGRGPVAGAQSRREPGRRWEVGVVGGAVAGPKAASAVDVGGAGNDGTGRNVVDGEAPLRAAPERTIGDRAGGDGEASGRTGAGRREVPAADLGLEGENGAGSGDTEAGTPSRAALQGVVAGEAGGGLTSGSAGAGDGRAPAADVGDGSGTGTGWEAFGAGASSRGAAVGEGDVEAGDGETSGLTGTGGRWASAANSGSGGNDGTAWGAVEFPRSERVWEDRAVHREGPGFAEEAPVTEGGSAAGHGAGGEARLEGTVPVREVRPIASAGRGVAGAPIAGGAAEGAVAREAAGGGARPEAVRGWIADAKPVETEGGGFAWPGGGGVPDDGSAEELGAGLNAVRWDGGGPDGTGLEGEGALDRAAGPAAKKDVRGWTGEGQPLEMDRGDLAAGGGEGVPKGGGPHCRSGPGWNGVGRSTGWWRGWWRRGTYGGGRRGSLRRATRRSGGE